MDVKRRLMLTDPGETLLLSKSSYEALRRFSDWQELTGLAPEQFTSDTLCSVPLPVYPTVAPGTRRFSSVKPAAMWHPLFWLPERVSGEYRLPTGPNGELEPESSALRSVRIALELTVSGLYDPETGTWADILSTVGIDVENPRDLARIAEWQAGGVDDTLDSIDLTGFLLNPVQPNWAIESALLLLETLSRAQWAVLADSLIELIDTAAHPDSGDAVLADVRDATALAAFLASLHLDAVPTDDEDPAVFWGRLEEDARHGRYGDVDAFLAGPVEDANGWLHLTREMYWGAVDELNTLQGV
jgi:hypothetical protein